MKLDYFDAEELARIVVGMTDDDDSDAVEEALADQFGISLEAFYGIMVALIPLTIPAEAALTGTAYQGFVKDGRFIVKLPARTAE